MRRYLGGSPGCWLVALIVLDFGRGDVLGLVQDLTSFDQVCCPNSQIKLRVQNGGSKPGAAAAGRRRPASASHPESRVATTTARPSLAGPAEAPSSLPRRSGAAVPGAAGTLGCSLGGNRQLRARHGPRTGRQLASWEFRVTECCQVARRHCSGPTSALTSNYALGPARCLHDGRGLSGRVLGSTRGAGGEAMRTKRKEREDTV